MKPERWKNPDNKLFPYQVGFTSPPYDYDAAPSDFLRTESLSNRSEFINDDVLSSKKRFGWSLGSDESSFVR